ncbi:hypothetical protein BRLA_c030160 [Brevibacillus laterosporus LMG 15441]|uniref:Uncharacterized protein n=1 Tax=Brevibacillus laterosporus LMG 15441 TaxID=1042163 RepID=A0A075R7X8_BRELA|nr:hypothetical protein BRLA_c030160 [Brevibacillus laterosporus LMG 15441]
MSGFLIKFLSEKWRSSLLRTELKIEKLKHKTVGIHTSRRQPIQL